MKDQITNWIINNIKNPYSPPVLSNAVPFAIWQRQWEISDLAGDRTRSREIADKVNLLAQKNREYAVSARLYSAQVYVYSAEYAKALDQAEEALAMCRQSDEQDRLPEIYNQISQAQQHLSNYEKAVEFSRMSAGIYEARNDKMNLGDALADLGLIYWKMGRYSEALSTLGQAGDIFQSSRDDRCMAVVMTNTANVLLATDEAEKAWEFYLKALEISRRIGDLAKQSTLHNNLGAMMFRRAEYSKAAEHFTRGLKIDEILGNLTGQGSKLNNMAVMMGSMGRHDEAMEYFERALKIDTATGNLDGQMRKLGNIATLHSIKGNYPKAIEYIDRAIGISQKISSNSYYVYFLSQKLGYLGNIKDYQAAKEVAREALNAMGPSGNMSQVVTLNSALADIYYETGEIDRALESSQKAVGIIETHQLFEAYKEDSWFTHSLILEKLGRAEEAERYHKMAYDEIRQKADNIKDEDERRGFLTKNRNIASIVNKWEEKHKKEA
jgi:tetratricopeptide (TPR) repeat protein